MGGQPSRRRKIMETQKRVCGVTGKECIKKSVLEISKCQLCEIGKEWIESNNGMKFHDED
jgi:hypothetical protein